MDEKTCTKCSEPKLILEFNKNQVWCKACQKQWREDNKEKIKEHNKNNQSKNKERVRKWREDNKEHVKKYNQKYYEKNKKYINERRRKK